MKKIHHLFTSTLIDCSNDRISHLSAALSYYTIFSFVPLLVICMGAVGLMFDKSAIQDQILMQLQGTLGQQSIAELQLIIANITKPTSSLLATTLGAILLIWTVSNLFDQLQTAFNFIWKVKPNIKNNLFSVIQYHFLSFVLMMFISFLLLISLVFSAFVAGISAYLYHSIPTATLLWRLLDFFMSIVTATVLFAIIYKVLPDVVIKWRDVILGAFVTAILFSLGKMVLNLYLIKSNVATPYGAAGSIIVIMLWVYYSAQILLAGAEFTKVYTFTYGSYRGKKRAISTEI